MSGTSRRGTYFAGIVSGQPGQRMPERRLYGPRRQPGFDLAENVAHKLTVATGGEKPSVCGEIRLPAVRRHRRNSPLDASSTQAWRSSLERPVNLAAICSNAKTPPAVSPPKSAGKGGPGGVMAAPTPRCFSGGTVTIQFAADWAEQISGAASAKRHRPIRRPSACASAVPLSAATTTTAPATTAICRHIECADTQPVI